MKILFSTGKGGVGKSTMAAAAAWQLSRDQRVLIISLDPAHNLGDIFGVTLAGGRKRFSANLHLGEVDLQQLSKEYLKREIDVLSGSYKYLQTLNLDNYFSVLKYSPGIEEYALLTSIEATIRNEEDYDIIIFDTPPTGLTLRFLALPRVTITWIDRLIQIRRKILEKRYTIQKIRGNPEEGTLDSGIILNYNEDDDDILRRLRVLKTNYETLTSILEGRDCAIFVVFNPDLLSLRESQRLVEGLHELHLPLRLMINNKVTTDNEAMADHVEKTMLRRAEHIPVERIALHRELQSRDATKLYEIEEDIASPLLFILNNAR
ncbi:MAG TPA: ArsA family ATPase [Deltaproteobacteria bacterium]|nr:ArsA family ATPase [Deltaproteobacteria bacterium]